MSFGGVSQTSWEKLEYPEHLWICDFVPKEQIYYMQTEICVVYRGLLAVTSVMFKSHELVQWNTV